LEKNSVVETIASYNVNKDLIENLALCLEKRVSSLLSPELANVDFGEKISITILYPSEEEKFATIREYLSQHPKLPFSNNIEGLKIELAHIAKHVDLEMAIYLSLSFGKEIDKNRLEIALLDESARGRVLGIKEEIFSILEHYKNPNRLIYRNEFFPTFFFVAGLGLAILTYINHSPFFRPAFGILSGVCIYLVAYRYIKGYCTFDTANQKRRDSFFKWLTTGIAGAILAIVLAAIRQNIFSR
jgi:hypothetical protein